MSDAYSFKKTLTLNENELLAQGVKDLPRTAGFKLKIQYGGVTLKTEAYKTLDEIKNTFGDNAKLVCAPFHNGFLGQGVKSPEIYAYATFLQGIEPPSFEGQEYSIEINAVSDNSISMIVKSDGNYNIEHHLSISCLSQKDDDGKTSYETQVTGEYRTTSQSAEHIKEFVRFMNANADATKAKRVLASLKSQELSRAEKDLMLAIMDPQSDCFDQILLTQCSSPQSMQIMCGMLGNTRLKHLTAEQIAQRSIDLCGNDLDQINEIIENYEDHDLADAMKCYFIGKTQNNNSDESKLSPRSMATSTGLLASLSVGFGLGFGMPSFTFASAASTVLFKVGTLTATAGLASTLGVALLAGLVVGAAVYFGVSHYNQSALASGYSGQSSTSLSHAQAYDSVFAAWAKASASASADTQAAEQDGHDRTSNGFSNRK